jgi:bifunctional DNase/RNase
MSEEVRNEVVPCSIERILPLRDGAAVVLKASDMSFLILVGPFEAQAMFREMHHRPTDRPMTHDALVSIMLGFDIQVQKVVISALLKGIFCATVFLRQPRENALHDEVRIDMRASDSLVLALKAKAPIFVAKSVLAQVPDASESLREVDALPPDEEESDPPTFE